IGVGDGPVLSAIQARYSPLGSALRRYASANRIRASSAVDGSTPMSRNIPARCRAISGMSELVPTRTVNWGGTGVREFPTDYSRVRSLLWTMLERSTLDVAIDGATMT